MANLKQNYIVKQNSEVFSYLPAPPDKNIFLYLTSFGHEFLENDYYLEREFSDVYMINYVAQGSLNFIYNGVKHTLNKGDLSFFYIGEHNVIYPTSESTEIYFFHIIWMTKIRFGTKQNLPDLPINAFLIPLKLNTSK